MDEYKIVQTNGHYEVYVNDVFYCSADTFMEAAEEVERFREKEN